MLVAFCDQDAGNSMPLEKRRDRGIADHGIADLPLDAVEWMLPASVKRRSRLTPPVLLGAAALRLSDMLSPLIGAFSFAP